MMRLCTDQSGYTLTELVVAMTVLVVLAAAIVTFSIGKTIQTAHDNIASNLLSNAHQGLDHMANDIRLSAAADDANRWPDSHAPSAPTNLYSWQSNATTLILASAAQTSTGTILFSDPVDYITTKNNFVYYLQNKTLYKRTLAAVAAGNTAVTSCPAGSASPSCPADKVVLTDIQSFSIQYYDSLNQQVDPASARSIQLNLVLQSTSFGTPVSAHYSTRMVFRNG